MNYNSTILLLIPAFIFAMLAQGKVKSAYSKYSRINIKRGMAGAEVARKILQEHGLGDMPIEVAKGVLSDHYDPRKRVIRLSSDIYHGKSIASVSVAAHEVGHAIQHSTGYAPLMIRDVIALPINVVSKLTWPLMFIGIIMMQISYETQGVGSIMFDIGIVAFVGVVIFHLITLPVEFNASKKAVKELQGMNVMEEEEMKGAKKMLSAAAMTYVAALAVAVIQLLRIIMVRRR